jgi:hypothetical protein
MIELAVFFKKRRSSKLVANNHHIKLESSCIPALKKKHAGITGNLALGLVGRAEKPNSAASVR